MWRVIRSILAVIAGFVAASAVMMVVETINGHVLYPELAKLSEGVTDQEVIRQIFANAPIGALLVVIFGWLAGSFLGGLVTAWISPAAPVAHALVLGALLTLAGIANNLMLPPPLWFWVVTLIVFVPAACAGARLAPPKPVQPSAISSQ